MANPARALAEQFVRRSPTELLVFGGVLSVADLLVLYAAAWKEGVLHVEQGVGLLTNYGLFSTLLGNAVYLYLAKKYYDYICSMRDSKAVVNAAPVNKSLSFLKAITKMRRRYRLGIYLSIVGAIAWVVNVSNHVFRDPEVVWGHKVFDSTDHPLTFAASRLHNIITWIIIMPLTGHVIVYLSVRLWRAVATAVGERALRYDLLNPDQRGGFAFVDKAAVTFNIILALAYAQVTIHIETFKTNPEHVLAYLLLTVLLIGTNRVFLGDIYAKVGALRLESLDKVKEDVFKNDKLSFEVLKYCYERRLSVSSVVNFAINPGAIVVSGVIKFWQHWPDITKALSGV
jgi:hypothetical protein